MGRLTDGKAGDTDTGTEDDGPELLIVKEVMDKVGVTALTWLEKRTGDGGTELEIFTEVAENFTSLTVSDEGREWGGGEKGVTMTDHRLESVGLSLFMDSDSIAKAFLFLQSEEPVCAI
eukprot:gb/GEZN01013114.1/.p2 GENE.gb/GEZN01013114.1/~~gb/GEZN01013114.1/.p2  ORF type:complete len:119 (+),score=18.66 gb/GEZN01013114.1/:656-1012(+)